jgi:type II secretory pathway pseudopilin PulG
MRNGDTRVLLLRRPATRQGGFTYLGVLIAVAIIGVTLATTGEVWHTAQKRERERELLFVGDQIRQAIGRYYRAGAQYPQTLDDLLRDPRHPGVVRYLRKRYYDPITGTTEWGLIRDSGDRIVGVHSRSEEQPIKQANFAAADRGFEGKKKYSEWTFVYQARRVRVQPTVQTTMQPEAGAAEPRDQQ